MHVRVRKKSQNPKATLVNHSYLICGVIKTTANYVAAAEPNKLGDTDTAVILRYSKRTSYKYLLSYLYPMLILLILSNYTTL